MFFLLFFIFLVVYVGFLLKYMVLEQFGTEAQATIITKQDNYMSRLEADQRGGLLKALIGRHTLAYRFEPEGQERCFGEARVNDFVFQNTLADEELPVLYLQRYPHINCLKTLLLVRFREMMAVGGVFLFFMSYVSFIVAANAPVNAVVQAEEKRMHDMLEQMPDQPQRYQAILEEIKKREAEREQH